MPGAGCQERGDVHGTSLDITDCPVLDADLLTFHRSLHQQCSSLNGRKQFIARRCLPLLFTPPNSIPANPCFCPLLNNGRDTPGYSLPGYSLPAYRLLPIALHRFLPSGRGGVGYCKMFGGVAYTCLSQLSLPGRHFIPRKFPHAKRKSRKGFLPTNFSTHKQPPPQWSNQVSPPIPPPCTEFTS